MKQARLDGAVLIKADLAKADLTEADLTEANLREADLTGADLTEARGMTQEQLDGTIGSLSNIQLPEGLQCPEL